MTRACGHCYHLARPTEYEPNTYIWGKCSVCGDETFVHRISRAEADALREKETK